jgi:hypothetical protein
MKHERLKVLGEIRKAGRLYYRCSCSCGEQKTIRADNIRSGFTGSCGCLGRELASKRLQRIHRQAQEGNEKSSMHLPEDK